MEYNQPFDSRHEKQLPELLLLFMAVDWPLYMRRPAVFALAEAAKQFGTTVVAINRPLCPFTTLFRKPGRLRELFGHPGLEKLADNLYLYSPRYVLHDHLADHLPGFQALNRFALRHSLKYLQKQLNVREEKPIVLFNYPQQGYVVDLYESCFSVYELYDELCSIDGQQNSTMVQKEKELRKRVNLLLTTSHALHDKYGPHYENSIMYGNGLSRDAFEQLRYRSSSESDLLSQIPSPRIGYVGMLSDRLNWQLITKLAQSAPEWQFVFVGPTSDPKISSYGEELSNLHILGPVPQSTVPDVLHSLDVGIMPYLDTPFFRYLNALKFYEMAAAGLPMLTSPVDEMKRYSDTIISVVENDVESWRLAIEKGLNADRTEVVRLGQETAGQFVWEDMAERLLRNMSRIL